MNNNMQQTWKIVAASVQGTSMDLVEFPAKMPTTLKG